MALTPNPPLFLSTVFCLSMVLSSCEMTGSQPPSLSHDGLERVATKSLDEVYRRPGIDLADYHSFIVRDCSVAFKKYWQRDYNSTTAAMMNRITDDDMAKTKARLGKLCHEVFVEELTRDEGYPMVTSAAVDVMELRPTIVDLDINAPDTRSAGSSRSYTTSAGSMTLYLEAYDSLTGEILGRIVDKRKSPENSQLQWTNSVTNTRDAKRILRRWGKILREMADQTRRADSPD